MRMQLVLDTKDLKVDRRRNLFFIEAPDGTTRSVSPRKVTSIAVTQPCWISAGAVELAALHEIPILYFNFLGKAVARLSSPYFGSIATLRRRQALFHDTPEATRWMVGLYLLKSEQQAENLRRLQPEHTAIGQMKNLWKRLEFVAGTPLREATAPLMAAEAAIARYYWQALSELLPDHCDFQKRSRQPAQDNFNAALNYLYGMLYTVVESGLFAAGLDPHLGLMHADEYNKPVLAFDFIEPFRPWADWLLIQQFLDHKVRAAFFNRTATGVFLNKAGKAFFIPLFNQWLRSERTWANKKTTVKNHIYQLAGRFSNKLRSLNDSE